MHHKRERYCIATDHHIMFKTRIIKKISYGDFIALIEKRGTDKLRIMTNTFWFFNDPRFRYEFKKKSDIRAFQEWILLVFYPRLEKR